MWLFHTWQSSTFKTFLFWGWILRFFGVFFVWFLWLFKHIWGSNDTFLTLSCTIKIWLAVINLCVGPFCVIKLCKIVILRTLTSFMLFPLFFFARVQVIKLLFNTFLDLIIDCFYRTFRNNVINLSLSPQINLLQPICVNFLRLQIHIYFFNHMLTFI